MTNNHLSVVVTNIIHMSFLCFSHELTFFPLHSHELTYLLSHVTLSIALMISGGGEEPPFHVMVRTLDYQITTLALPSLLRYEETLADSYGGLGMCETQRTTCTAL